MNKNIDFDAVADLYDRYVYADFDVEFWREEAHAAGGRTLELMCGTGRLGLPLIEAGVPYTGLDYCRGLLDQFQHKLASREIEATLVDADARQFELDGSFDLVFIGFHSLAEVLEDSDKIRLLECVRAHLKPTGWLTLSLHNPAVRARSCTGKRSPSQVIDLDDDGRTLEYCTRFDPPSVSGIVSGAQFYTIKDSDGHTAEERRLAIRFHLITKAKIESLLDEAGFEIKRLWGDYDRSAFAPSSPYMIYRCRARNADSPTYA